jgi:hypothetical protein
LVQRTLRKPQRDCIRFIRGGLGWGKGLRIITNFSYYRPHGLKEVKKP